MPDNVTLQDEVDLPPPQNQRVPRSERGHHRPWWIFNLIPLLLALFPLSYVRHLWNVDHSIILAGVFVIFMVWILVGVVGHSFRAQTDRHRIALSPRLILSVPPLAVVFITFTVAAIYLGGTFSGVGGGRALLNLFYSSPSTLPVFIVLVISYAVVQRKRKKHPTMWRYASIGIGGLMFSSCLKVILPLVGYSGLVRGWSQPELLVLLWSQRFLVVLIDVACWVLVVMAILADRGDE